MTLEPCNHHGLTPPCTKAIIDAGISRVVFGMRNYLNPDVAGRGMRKPQGGGNRGRWRHSRTGMQNTNQSFIKYVTTGLPYVTLKAAATLDGFIATSSGDSKWITGALSREFAHGLRPFADGVVVGVFYRLADHPARPPHCRKKKPSPAGSDRP